MSPRRSHSRRVDTRLRVFTVISFNRADRQTDGLWSERPITQSALCENKSPKDIRICREAVEIKDIPARALIRSEFKQTFSSGGVNGGMKGERGSMMSSLICRTALFVRVRAENIEKLPGVAPSVEHQAFPQNCLFLIGIVLVKTFLMISARIEFYRALIKGSCMFYIGTLQLYILKQWLGDSTMTRCRVFQSFLQNRNVFSTGQRTQFISRYDIKIIVFKLLYKIKRVNNSSLKYIY